MSDQPKKRWSPIKITMTLVIVLVLYFLSIGPAAWVVYNKVPGRYFDTAGEALDFVYTPLVWLAGESEAFDDLYMWYLLLWLP